ncbi:catalase family peroxidase [Pseudomonas sp. CHM02]|uniref:catalase family peroxidase n=1 Tax=Pseudomonas sp. CHM02 TaxID=1463662 RepID=UPI000470432C|nr:catalase family peroxidase [Pseudomonas sp. CHM02]
MKKPFPLNKRHRLPLAVAAAVVITGLGVWLRPSFSAPSPTAAQIVDQMEAVAGGAHAGFRRNHAKGQCISGRFESNGNAVEISSAAPLRRGSVTLIGRLSAAGGDPAEPDVLGMNRSMALRLAEGDGSTWYMAMNSVPVFPVSTPEGLYAQLRASIPEYGGAGPDPQKMQAFKDAHPEMRAFEDWLAANPASSGFDNTTFYSVNAFRMIDAQGRVRFVRWSMVPETPYAAISAEQRSDPDFLAFGLATQLERGPLRWHLIITLADPGDVTNNATVLWPQGRRQIDAGVLVIDVQQSQVDGACRDIDFNPLELPAGIEPSDDPLLLARQAAYAESHRRRIEEASAR